MEEATVAIKTGDKVPAGKFTIMKKDGPGALSTDELFRGKKVVLFSVPGAFTPTCSKQHLPGFVTRAAALKEKGIDTVACMSVNDVFVMDAWGRSAGAEGQVLMLADGNAEYAKALGLTLDASGFGMGLRAQRFSMLVEDGVVRQLNLEESPAQCTTSSAEHILGKV
jgi:peroxiredoxin